MTGVPRNDFPQTSVLPPLCVTLVFLREVGVANLVVLGRQLPLALGTRREFVGREIEREFRER